MSETPIITCWQYCGNHPDGVDCARNTPTGYEMGDLCYLFDYDRDFSRVTMEILESNDFGRTIKVSAIPELWGLANGILSLVRCRDDNINV